MAVTFPSGVYPALASVDVLNLLLISILIGYSGSPRGSVLCGVDTDFDRTCSWSVHQLELCPWAIDAYRMEL